MTPIQHSNPSLDQGWDADDSLFFTDTSPHIPTPDVTAQKSPEPAARWHDHDDDNTDISIASIKRFKKLRKSVDDDKMTASQLSARLASHFTCASRKIPHWSLSRTDRLEMRRKKRMLAKKRKTESDLASKALHSALFPGIIDTPIIEMNDDALEAIASDEEYDFLHEQHSLLSSTTPLLARTSPLLPKDQLMVARLPNLSYSHESVVASVAFHPSVNILVTAGLDKTLRLSQIDGRSNPVLGRVYFGDLPIHTVSLHPSGTHALVSGRRPYSYSYHLETGAVSRIPPFAHVGDSVLPSLEEMHISPSGHMLAFVGASGNIVLVDEKTRTWICNLKMNGSIRAVTWVSDAIILSIGGDGVVYVWDVPSRRCISKWADHGGFKNGAIASGLDGQWLATGSHAGIVNVYRTNSSTPSHCYENQSGSPPSPATSMALSKSIDNLTTPIYKLGFSHDAQILGMFSRSKKDQFKLVHLPSCTVFANWPTQRTPLSHVQCFDFSPHSGILAIGNEKGKVLLYNLKHYHSY